MSRAAVLSSGLAWPMRRVTVNLAPSGVRKGGAGLDLPIAVGLLAATGELPQGCAEGLAFCGELGLNGSLRHVPGMIALADATAPLGWWCPWATCARPMLVRGSGGARRGDPAGPDPVLRGQVGWPEPPPTSAAPAAAGAPDLADVRGQAVGRRASKWRPRRTSPSPHDRPARVRQDHVGRAAAGLAPAPHRGRRHSTVTRVHSTAGCACPRACCSTARPSGPRITRLPWPRWSAGGAGPCAPARSRLPLTGSCSSMSSASSPSRPRGTAPAPRGRRDPGEPGGRDGDVPGGLPACCGHESVPVRRGRL